MQFPRFLLAHQRFPSFRINDIRGEVQRQLDQSGFASGLKPGSRIAIGVGSRGIANLAEIVIAAVDWWKGQGMKPFLFPAMGSHGAGTASGQAAVLAKYGLTQQSAGCPVISSLSVVELGVTAEGIPTYLDRAAARSDGIMLVSRVKWHTSFEGPLESGLYKMMAIGLGKLAGAKLYHTHAYKLGMNAMIQSVGRKILQTGKILGGLAIVEDANHETARLAAVPVNEMAASEAKLLEQAKAWMPRIPLKHLDILIIDEIGKTISGAGMDPKIINRGANGEQHNWYPAPLIERIFVRDLRHDSYGNAIGIGMADVTHSRLVKKMKKRATWVNALTASSPGVVKLPVYFPTDRQCLEEMATTVGKFDPMDLRIAWIRNTLELGTLAVTENLADELRETPYIELEKPAQELQWDTENNLVSWLGSREEAATIS